MNLRRRPRCPTSARRWWLAGAVLAVLAAQWLALVHTVVHAGARAWPVLETAAPHPAPSAWVQLLVAGHDAGSASCLLLDQLAQAAPCADPPAALPPALPSAAHDDASIARVLPAGWAGFRARGPPHVG